MSDEKNDKKVPETEPEELPSLEMDPALAAALADAENFDRTRASGDEVVIEEEDDDGEGVELTVDAGGGAPPTSGGASEGLVRALSQMREAMERAEAAEARVEELEGDLKRSVADLENYKKRVLREKEADKKFANERIIKELLAPIDNMERAIEAAQGSSLEKVVEGIEMVHRQLISSLGTFGVSQFSSLGEKFDPELHEAMQQVETADAEPGTVVTEYMKGYKLHDRLIRPSMVVVATAPADAGASSDSSAGDGASESEATAGDPVDDAGDSGSDESA